MQRRVTATGSVLRLVLLAITLLGLAGMHVLGHEGVAHTAAMLVHDRTPQLGGLTAQMSGGSLSEVVTPAGCPDLTCAEPAEAPGGGMHGWSVCLAVLAGVATVALVAWLLQACVRPMPRIAPMVLVAGGPCRAPPPQVGLRLADLSVQRT